MVVFDKVIEVLRLSQNEVQAAVVKQAAQRGRIRTALVDRDRLRIPVKVDCLLEEERVESRLQSQRCVSRIWRRGRARGDRECTIAGRHATTAWPAKFAKAC